MCPFAVLGLLPIVAASWPMWPPPYLWDGLVLVSPVWLAVWGLHHIARQLARTRADVHNFVAR